MANIRGVLVIATVCAVVAGNAEEEGANTHVSLGEFDLDDQCYKTAETEWKFLTRSEGPEALLLQQSKVSKRP
jgi:hypothetical protein